MCLLIFREGRRKRERERDINVRNIDRLPPICTPTRDQTGNPLSNTVQGMRNFIFTIFPSVILFPSTAWVPVVDVGVSVVGPGHPTNQPAFEMISLRIRGREREMWSLMSSEALVRPLPNNPLEPALAP